jgi:hypothetical protein
MSNMMATTASTPRPAALRRVGVLALAAAIALGACGGSASLAPTSGPAGASGTPGTASQGPGDTGGPNGGTAFGAATTALAALDSYAFKVEVQSSTTTGSTTTASHQVMSGVVENKPDKASSLQQADLDADGNTTSSTGIVTIGDRAWLQDGVDGPWTEVPAAQAGVFIQTMAAFRPEQMFGLYFAGLGGNFTGGETETKNGIPSTHYTGDEAVGTMLGSIAGFQGTWKSDVWIANDGGYLVHSEASATPAAGPEAGGFLIVVDITDPNAAGPVQPPS